MIKQFISMMAATSLVSADTTISITVILSILSAIGVIFSITMGVKKDSREEEERRIDIAEQFAKVNVKLDQFGTTIYEMNRRSEYTMEEMKKVNISIARCDERIETLFKYHDDHEKRLAEIEGDK